MKWLNVSKVSLNIISKSKQLYFAQKCSQETRNPLQIKSNGILIEKSGTNGYAKIANKYLQNNWYFEQIKTLAIANLFLYANLLIAR